MRWCSINDLETARGGAESARAFLAHLSPADQDQQLTGAIDFAEGRVLSMIAVKYRQEDLPTDPAGTPALLKSLTVDLAYQRLLETNGGIVPDAVKLAGERALAHLRDIARGLATLTLTPVPASDDQLATVAAIDLGQLEIDGKTLDLEGWRF